MVKRYNINTMFTPDKRISIGSRKALESCQQTSEVIREVTNEEDEESIINRVSQKFHEMEEEEKENPLDKFVTKV